MGADTTLRRDDSASTSTTPVDVEGARILEDLPACRGRLEARRERTGLGLGHEAAPRFLDHEVGAHEERLLAPVDVERVTRRELPFDDGVAVRLEETLGQGLPAGATGSCERDALRREGAEPP
jgi:hypothetical protein